MTLVSIIAVSVFAVVAVGQLLAERLTALPIAPGRMLVVGVGLIGAIPVSVSLAERWRGRLGWWWRGVVGASAPALLLAALLGLVRASGGPLGPIPGGTLSGRLAPTDLDPTVLDRTKYVQLEADGPHSVELIVVRVGADVFVGANYPQWKVWPDLVAAHPPVVLRVGELLYPRTAVEITDAELSARLLHAMSHKYGFDVSLGTGLVRFFRLEARGGDRPDA